MVKDFWFIFLTVEWTALAAQIVSLPCSSSRNIIFNFKIYTYRSNRPIVTYLVPFEVRTEYGLYYRLTVRPVRPVRVPLSVHTAHLQMGTGLPSTTTVPVAVSSTKYGLRSTYYRIVSSEYRNRVYLLWNSSSTCVECTKLRKTLLAVTGLSLHYSVLYVQLVLECTCGDVDHRQCAVLTEQDFK